MAGVSTRMLPALFSRRYSHKHHHYHQLSCVALRSSSYKPSSHPRLFPSAVSSMTSSDSGPLSEPRPDVAFSSLFVALFFLLVRVAVKLRSRRLSPPRFGRLCCLAVKIPGYMPDHAQCYYCTGLQVLIKSRALCVECLLGLTALSAEHTSPSRLPPLHPPSQPPPLSPRT